MSWRTVVITSNCKADYQAGCIVIRSKETRKVFLDEINVIIFETTAVALTTYLINELLKRKIDVIFCDEKRNPCAILQPLYGSHDTSRKVIEQTAFTDSIKRKVWKSIVQEKILNQAKLLNLVDTDKSQTLIRYSAQVQDGDSTNREGHAAKVYFNTLFGKDFNRNQDSNRNVALNYGYALLLSMINREITANGYITQLGLFHRNKFNQYNLGSDLMEPFRPIVDYLVFTHNMQIFDKNEKRILLTLFDYQVTVNGRSEYFSNAVRIYVKSIFDALTTGDLSLIHMINIEFGND